MAGALALPVPLWVGRLADDLPWLAAASLVESRRDLRDAWGRSGHGLAAQQRWGSIA